MGWPCVGCSKGEYPSPSESGEGTVGVRGLALCGMLKGRVPLSKHHRVEGAAQRPHVGLACVRAGVVVYIESWVSDKPGVDIVLREGGLLAAPTRVGLALRAVGGGVYLP